MHNPNENPPEPHLLISLDVAESVLQLRDDYGDTVPMYRNALSIDRYAHNGSSGPALVWREVNVRALASDLLASISVNSGSTFVCERCEGLFEGEHWSASNCNETGVNVSLCAPCCRSVQFSLDDDRRRAANLGMGAV